MAEEDCGALGSAAVLAAKPAHATKANTRARIGSLPSDTRPSQIHHAPRCDFRPWPIFHKSVGALILWEEFRGGEK
jgi:hypothetical protein